VQGGGGGYGAGWFKNWWEGMDCETCRNHKNDGYQRRETQTLTKKTTKKQKRSDTEKKKKEVNLVLAGLDLMAFLKGPEG
jgi:hypothetical protein